MTPRVLYIGHTPGIQAPLLTDCPSLWHIDFLKKKYNVTIACATHQVRSEFTIDINMILHTVYQIFVDFFKKSVNYWEGQSGKMLEYQGGN